MELISILGLLSLGSLVTVGALAGFVAWVCRGHRVDLTNIRLVNTTDEKHRRSAFGPYKVSLKEPGVPTDGAWLDEKPKGEDFYEMAKERSGE